MSALDDLRAARALIADRANWTRLVNARDARHNVVDAQADTAVCWCAQGALFKVSESWRLPGARFLTRASLELYSAAPARVNDNLGHADVLRMYDRAIEMAEAQS